MGFRHRIPAVWFSLKKSMKCKTHPSQVYDPEASADKSRKREGTCNSSPCSFASDEIPDPHPATAMLLDTKSQRGGAGAHHQANNNKQTVEVVTPPPPPGPGLIKQQQQKEEYPNDTCTYTDLSMGDSTRNVVEIIVRTSWCVKKTPCAEEEHQQQTEMARIHRVLKINNGWKMHQRFEEYRAVIKTKASAERNKHARCMADGNELLRFYPTSIACLGLHDAPCNSVRCDACRTIETGFCRHNGIWTTATSASSSIQHTPIGFRRAVVVCRVIAGRIRKPNNNNEILLKPHDRTAEFQVPHGFDSMAGTSAGTDSKLELLYVSNPAAVLPCFLVIYS